MYSLNIGHVGSNLDKHFAFGQFYECFAFEKLALHWTIPL